MRRLLEDVKFEDLKDRSFKVVRVTLKLCEVCDGVINVEERMLRDIKVSNPREYRNLLIRFKPYDRVEIDVEEARIYLFDHDYPGDVHPECLEKM